MLKSILENRKLIGNLAKDDFKKKFAGSSFGVIWAFIQPVITVLIYWFVFEKGLHAVLGTSLYDRGAGNSHEESPSITEQGN